MICHRQFSPEYYRKSLDILETSLDQLHAYRSWRAFDPGSECSVDRRYAAMPALTKQDIREHFPQGFVPPGHDIRHGLDNGEIHLVTTSGSSDTIVTNIWNQAWWDASERASWKLNSHATRLATGNHPEAILANPRNVGFISDEVDLPFEKRRLARFLYLNEKTDPSRWTPWLMDRMIHELNIFQPVILEANPSLLARLCRYAVDCGEKVFQPGLIIFTYEYPSRWHYRQIRRVFASPTASSYGTTESGYVFMQCEAGKLHQNSEFCRVDFQPLKKEHGGPGLGRMLVTTFNNPWYFMVRFDVGDLARLDDEGRCPCGRNSGFILSAIEGRFTNATLTVDGRLITLRQLDDALNALEGLDEYRLEQPSQGEYVLYLVSRQQNRGDLGTKAMEILRGLYGQDAKVSLVYEEDLSPEESGKYCLAKTLFPMEIEQYLDRECISR
jgi:phenylacetate-coenzyme A ligase PaaK-like adenylate-forming protein